MTELVPGAIIAAKFRLERVIGKGGMGSVWAARHTHLDMPVALKFMDPLADSPEARVRFEREAKAAAALRSPHVVQIIDHGLDDGVPYIAMELLEGEDLGERLRREKKLSLVVASRIFTQAAKALKKAHDGGIIHRDLKPSNIFLARFDEDEVVKLLDFGVAKLRSPGGGLDPNNQATQTGVVFGSPSYMSPEQARGVRVLDHRTDLWSLAVILFRSITGEKPFLGDSIGDLVIKLCIDPLPIATQVAPGLPPSIDVFFERAFAREPDRRFPDATALAAAFEAIVSGQPMKPVLPTAAPLGGQVSRPPRPLGAGAPPPPLAQSFSPSAPQPTFAAPPPTPASGSLLAPVSLTPPPDSSPSAGSFRVRKQELGDIGQVVAAERTGPNVISGSHASVAPTVVGARPASFVPTPPPSSSGASYAPGAFPPGVGPRGTVVNPKSNPPTGTLVLPQGANVPSTTPPSGAAIGWNNRQTLPLSDVPHSPQPGVIDLESEARRRAIEAPPSPPSSFSIVVRDLVERAKQIDEATRKKAVVAGAGAITTLVVVILFVSMLRGPSSDGPSVAATASPEVTAPVVPPPPPPEPTATAAVEPPPAVTPAPPPTPAPTASVTAAPTAEATSEPDAVESSSVAAPNAPKRYPAPAKTATPVKKKHPNFGY